MSMLPPTIDERSTGPVQTTCLVDTGGKRLGKDRIFLSPLTLMGILSKVIIVLSIFKEVVQNL